MYLLSCLQKERMKDAAAVGAEISLDAAGKTGWQALGMNGGEIAVGKDADLVLIDLSAPSMRPLSDIKKSLVYAADTSAVLLTMAKGKILYENGEYHIGESVETVYKNAGKCIKRLLKEANG